MQQIQRPPPAFIKQTLACLFQEEAGTTGRFMGVIRKLTMVIPGHRFRQIILLVIATNEPSNRIPKPKPLRQIWIPLTFANALLKARRGLPPLRPSIGRVKLGPG